MMEINGTIIENTHAEAFNAWAIRLIVTAAEARWVEYAVRSVTGYGTSVIGCDAEVGLEEVLDPSETPDGRPGASILFFWFKPMRLAQAAANRVGQCLMTCPTTAVFDGLNHLPPTRESIRVQLGKTIRYFGDGYQTRKAIGDRHFCAIPVMDGEFLVEETVGATQAVGGGNFLICGSNQKSALTAALTAVEAISHVPGVITPFPGGVVRSGSKVGSRYPEQKASTNHLYCPTLRNKPESKLQEGVACTYEIVIDGLNEKAVADAMAAGIRAACGPEIICISAGNYGGKLGTIQFHLQQLLAEPVGTP